MISINRSIRFIVATCLLLLVSARADNNTSLGLLRAIQDEPEPAFAPTALLDMMSLLYYGSAGSSERQLSALFGGASREEVAKAAAKSQRKASGYSRIGSVWFSERVQVTTDFYQAISKQWGFHVSAAPLRTDPGKAAQDINFWYDQQTRGYIKEVVPPPLLEDKPDMLAVMATAFLSPWKTPFEESKTKQAMFYQSSEQQFRVQMMQATAKFPYTDDEVFQVLSVPLEMDDFQILYLLPKDARQFKDALNSLKDAYLEKVIKQLKPQLVQLDLPRVSFQVNRNWRDVFIKSKLSAPFTEGQANLSRINDNKPEELYIAKLIEQVEITWNEAGMTARSTAAASAEPFGAASKEKKAEAIEFNANHPFIFILYNKKENDIAFTGIIEAQDQMGGSGR